MSTSRPNPDAILEVYEKLAAEGADEIVSVHISAELSGTFESAQLAARRCVGPGDAGGLPPGRDGHRVRRTRRGGRASTAAPTPRRPRRRPATRAANTTSLFYVDTLEYLRRGGRMGAAAALVGSALAVKPILTVDDGRVGPFEKVRTSAKALSPARGARRGGGRRRRGRRRGRAPGQPRPRRRSWPTRLGDRLEQGPAGPRGRRSARSAPSSAPTSARAWWPWRSPGAAERPQPACRSEFSTGRRDRPSGRRAPLPSVGACTGSHRRRSLRPRVDGSSCWDVSSSRPGCAGSTTTSPSLPDPATFPSLRSWRRSGRHARPSRPGAGPDGVAAGCGDQVPDTLRGRTELGSGPVLLVVALVALALAGTVVRGAADARRTASPCRARDRPPSAPAAAPLRCRAPRPRRRRGAGRRQRDRRRGRQGPPSGRGHPARGLAGGRRAAQGGRCPRRAST